ncbi:nuclear transport factor 2 family protein [Pimelobacter simplex]|uniref:nuclear transport factor 2 family protein n=1 Tax=Nocardioides simplex TaxID=2045 RepID=UPI003AAABC14
MTELAEVPAAVVIAATRLYARQSRLIDEGDAPGWAATFTADGVFDSPSYPEPAVGTAALVRFAEDFRASCARTATRLRHVVTTVDVLPVPAAAGDPARVVAHAYLQIVATPAGEESRLVRLTTLTDELVRDDAAPHGWRVARRRVRRDDQNHLTENPTQQGASA